MSDIIPKIFSKKHRRIISAVVGRVLTRKQGEVYLYHVYLKIVFFLLILYVYFPLLNIV